MRPVQRAALVLLLMGSLTGAAPAFAQGLSQCDQVPGNIVTVCGFEANILGHWTGSAPFGGFFGGDGVRTHSGGGAFMFGSVDGSPTSHTEAYDDLNESLYLTQTLNTTPGATYTLSFWLLFAPGTSFYNPNNFPPGSPFLWNQFTADWGGTQVFLLHDYNPFIPMNPNGTFPYERFTTGPLLATALTTDLRLGGFNTISALVLDDVVVTEDVPVNTTPEPASFALIGTGLVGVIGVARRRKRRARA